MKIPFFALRAKKALAQGRSPAKKLQVRNVQNSVKLYMIAQNCTGMHRTVRVQECTSFLLILWDCTGLNRIVLDFIGFYRIAKNCTEVLSGTEL